MKLLLLAMLCVFYVVANSTNYYFSSSLGNDSRTNAEAQNPATPWQTISKVNSIFSILKPGDSVLFKRGDTFYGPISCTYARSGTSGSPIVLSAYGNGAKPVISGFTNVANWTSIGGGIYEKVLSSAQSTLNMVLFDNNVQPMGRWPKLTAVNRGYLTVGSHAANTSITASSANGGLPGNPNYNGGEVVIRKSPWVLDRSSITNHSGNTIAYSPINGSGGNPTDGYGFFIQNHVNTLTESGEWCYEASSKKIKMFFGSEDPASHSIKASVIDIVVDMPGNQYITFDNIEFEGSNSKTFRFDNCTNIKINNCNIVYSGTDAIHFWNDNSPYITISNNIISNSNNNAITVANSKNCTIQNNTITNTGVIPGTGSSGGGNTTAISYLGNNGLVEYNKIISTGYNGIHMNGSATTVRFNYIDTFCTVKDDGAGIYTWSAPFTGNGIIQQNIILNGTGAMPGTTSSQGAAFGIYLDDNSADWQIADNTCANNEYAGIYIHNSRRLGMTGNTCYGNKLYQWNYTNDGGGINTLTVQNNIYLQPNPANHIGSFNDAALTVSTWGTIDNNYYLRPLDTAGTFMYIHGPCCSQKTFSGWKSLSGQDANSTNIPPVAITNINQVRFEYNETTTNKVIPLGGNYMSANGTLYPGSVTLAPYTSAVLFAAGPINQPPAVNAGLNQNITLPANSVTLNGSGTDPDGSIAAYQWTKIAGPATFTIVSPAQASTVINNLVQGVYQFELKVTDNNGAFGRDTVIITVNSATNQSPTANAGLNQNITLPANSVTLNGSGTDPDGTITAYQWTKIAGPATFTIVSPAQASTVINNLVPGVYQFELRVTDNLGLVGKDTVAVTVNDVPNQMPTANAGLNQNITLPANSVTLNGTGADPDGTITAYQWTKIAGPVTFTIVSPAQASTIINNLVQGVYQFELKVTDNRGAFGKDTVIVTVNANPNQAPTANAGLNQNITLPANSVTLNGSGTDPDGTIAAYQWIKIAGPATFTIVSPAQASTLINNLVQGVYQFELRVTDNNGAFGRDTVQVTVNASAGSNKKPTSNVGPVKRIKSTSSSIMMRGSGTDVDGTIVSYRWSQISGPAQNTILSPTQPETEITNLTTGVYQFALTVTDNHGATGADTAEIIIADTLNTAITVFPNPARDIINVKIDGAATTSNMNMIIYDVSGKMVYSESFIRNQTSLIKQINVSAFPGGAYIIKVTSAIGVNMSIKMIKQ